MKLKNKDADERPAGLRFEPSIPRRITTVTAVRHYPVGQPPFVVAWVGYCYSCGKRHAVLVNGNPLAYEIASAGILGHKCPGTKRGSQS